MGGDALTARQVERLVNAERAPRLAYTTVRTALERLVERGVVRRERRGTAFLYRSSAGESEMVDQLVAALVEGLSGFGPGTLRAVRDRLDCSLEDNPVAS